MEHFIIELGKCLYGLGWFTTTNGQKPTDYQYYGVGLYIFVFGCVSYAILFIIFTIYLWKKIKLKKKGR